MSIKIEFNEVNYMFCLWMNDMDERQTDISYFCPTRAYGPFESRTFLLEVAKIV